MGRSLDVQELCASSYAIFGEISPVCFHPAGQSVCGHAFDRMIRHHCRRADAREAGRSVQRSWARRSRHDHAPRLHLDNPPMRPSHLFRYTPTLSRVQVLSKVSGVLVQLSPISSLQVGLLRRPPEQATSIVQQTCQGTRAAHVLKAVSLYT